MCIIVCSLFVVNLIIAQMMFKYAEVADESDVVDEFDKELYEISRNIFGPEHMPLAEWIIQRDFIKIEPTANKYLPNKKDFWQTFSDSQKVTIDQSSKYYNLADFSYNQNPIYT